jgi:hypothetical protein
MVSISYRGKEAILAWVVELETFTLSTHEVLGAGLWVVVFLWAKVATWVGVSYVFLSVCLRVVLVFGGGWGMVLVVAVVFDVLWVILEGFWVVIVWLAFGCVGN